MELALVVVTEFVVLNVEPASVLLISVGVDVEELVEIR